MIDELSAVVLNNNNNDVLCGGQGRGYECTKANIEYYGYINYVQPHPERNPSFHSDNLLILWVIDLLENNFYRGKGDRGLPGPYELTLEKAMEGILATRYLPMSQGSGMVGQRSGVVETTTGRAEVTTSKKPQNTQSMNSRRTRKPTNPAMRKTKNPKVTTVSSVQGLRGEISTESDEEFLESSETSAFTLPNDIEDETTDSTPIKLVDFNSRRRTMATPNFDCIPGKLEFEIKEPLLLSFPKSLQNNCPEVEGGYIRSVNLGDSHSLVHSFFEVPFKSINYLTIKNEKERGNLRKIGEHAFKNLPNLLDLEIVHHQIAFVAHDTFEFNKNLSSIDFSDNEIKVLDPYVFRGLFQLTEINFSLNRIESLDSELFKDNSNLELINFQRNRINEIGLNTFTKISKKWRKINLESNACYNELYNNTGIIGMFGECSEACANKCFYLHQIESIETTESEEDKRCQYPKEMDFLGRCRLIWRSGNEVLL